MRAMLDQLMGTGRDGELGWLWLRCVSDKMRTGICVVASISPDKLTSVADSDSEACFENRAS